MRCINKYNQFSFAAIIISILLFGSCMAERRAIREVDELIASYGQVARDTSVLFCADTTMTSFCITVNFYTRDQKLLKATVTGDDSLGRRTVTYYFDKNGLIKSVGNIGKEMKPETYYFTDKAIERKRKKGDDALMPFQNEAMWLVDVYYSDIYPVRHKKN